MSIIRQGKNDFVRWWVEVCGRKLPKNRASLLMDLRKISDLQTQLNTMKELYRQDEDCLIQFDQQQTAWLAAKGLDEK